MTFLRTHSWTRNGEAVAPTEEGREAEPWALSREGVMVEF